MKVIKKIGTVVINFLMAIVTIIVLFLMYRFIMVKFCHKKYVTTFGYSMFEIATGSMEPTLNVYDFILGNEEALKKRPVIREEMFNECKEMKVLMVKCWDSDMEKRPTMKEIVEIIEKIINNDN